jgi:hypothetical protein
MPDKLGRAIDPVGLIALANVLRFHGNMECSCELKCVCDQKCSCELKCVCDQKDGTNILDLLSNPAFREVVQGLDVERLRTIDDFMAIVEELRARMNASAKANVSKTPARTSARTSRSGRRP